MKDKLYPVINTCQSALSECTTGMPARIPELLAPAGDWDCAKAAVENGADAIYFGLAQFNARMRAHNFNEADLPKLMEFLHRRGVKGYVTFNTLIFENEMAEAEQYLRTIIASGVDAAIVQDIGICRLIRQLSPDFPIHVSTQMTITSAGGVEFARELGCNLVVLARECSLKEIQKMCRGSSGEFEGENSASIFGDSSTLPSTLDPRLSSLPLEVFVHGALCVAYSGQCLTSEALGGRSANRGECAQACRRPYELISDGRLVPLGDRRYLLSPQDLAGLQVLPDLVRAGVASLKIEGRLKSPEYVANITRTYRNALDELLHGTRPPSAVLSTLRSAATEDGLRRTGDTQHAPVLASQPALHAPRYEMQMAFSRGLYTGWLGGINNQALVHGRFGKKRGVYLGEVFGLRGESVAIHLVGPLKRGDGVVFDGGHPEEKEEGGRVYQIKARQASHRSQNGLGPAEDADKNCVLLSFGRGDINFQRVHIGDKVWKTSDPELERRLRKSFEGNQPRFQRPLTMEVHGRAGQPLRLIARDEQGDVVRLDSFMSLAKADKRP